MWYATRPRKFSPPRPRARPHHHRPWWHRPPRPKPPNTPATASFFYPAATNYATPDVLTSLSFNVLYGRVGQVEGVQIGGLVNHVGGDVRGLQVAGVSGQGQRSRRWPFPTAFPCRKIPSPCRCPTPHRWPAWGAPRPVLPSLPPLPNRPWHPPLWPRRHVSLPSKTTNSTGWRMRRTSHAKTMRPRSWRGTAT